jgi:hypothetical protein
MYRFVRLAALIAVVGGVIFGAESAGSTDPPYPNRIDFPAPTVDMTTGAVTTNFSPEGMAISGNTFYAGSTATGEIIKGDLTTGVYQRNWVPASPAQPSDLHRGTLGLLVDSHNRLWAADSVGMTCGQKNAQGVITTPCPAGAVTPQVNYGAIFVYDANTGAEIAQYTVTNASAKLMNDITIADNAVFISNTTAPGAVGTEQQDEIQLGPGGSLPPSDTPPTGNTGTTVPCGTTLCPTYSNAAVKILPTPGFTGADGIDTLPNGHVLFTSIAGTANGSMINMDPATGTFSLITVTPAAGWPAGIPAILSLDGVTIDGNMLYAPENRLDTAACPAPATTSLCPGDWVAVHLDPPSYLTGEVVARLNSPPGSGLPPLRSPANMEQLGHLVYGITRVIVPVTITNGTVVNTTQTFIENLNKLPLTATGSPVPAVEGASFTGPVANVADPNNGPISGDYPQNGSSVKGYTATINWGDGTATSAGTVSGTDSQIGVAGTHTYAEEGSYTVTTTVNDAATGASLVTATSTATVADAPLTVKGATIAGTEGASAAGVVATFTDPGTAADFTATINWGDGSTSSGTVAAAAAGGFQVTASHTYVDEGTYPTTITVKDDGGSTATGTGSAKIADAALTAGLVKAPCASSPCTATFGFTDANPGATVADFTATINWGDGSTSAGVVTPAAPGFVVTGSHTYAAAGGGHAVSFKVTDDGGSTAAGAAPAATAALVPTHRHDEGNSQTFGVVATCSSGTASAALNGVPVSNGDVVHLHLIKKGDQRVKHEDGHLKISATSFQLVVICTDTAGNSGSASAVPVFKTNGDDNGNGQGGNENGQGGKGGHDD